jgi:plasmid stabilization system protein ParE
MTQRYVLAPEAALDLVQIWRYIAKQSSVEIADRVESVIRDKIVFLAANPGAGHWRKNLTDDTVKFFPVYSYPDRLPAGKHGPPNCFHSSRPSRRRTTPQGSSMSVATGGLPVAFFLFTEGVSGYDNVHGTRFDCAPIGGPRSISWSETYETCLICTIRMIR